MSAAAKSVRSLTLVIAAASLLAATPGCSVFANMAYWWKGSKIPAKYAGLEEKRVAVVCLDANSLGGPGGEADAIARAVNVALAQNVPKVTMVRQSEIADWIDSQNQEVTDYRDVGRGVKADMVVGIDLMSFNIHEGQTLLRGKANVRVRVYDMKQGGEVVYESPGKEISWPENGARHVTENEANFKTYFIHTLAHKIARDYYDYESVEDYSLDAAHLAN
jgi:hypothetical protein